MPKLNYKIFFVILSFVIIANMVLACEKPYKLFHENGLYIVKIDLNKATIKPYVSTALETVDTIALKTGASVAINTGFFDAKNKKTVSYITENNTVIANPEQNENFMNNQTLKPYIDKILNRSELRILNCNGEVRSDITFHNNEINDDCKLLSSTQAGPQIIPEMNLEKEFFILKQNGKIVRDSVGLYRKTDRSMVAIKGKYLYFIITDEDSPLNINEMKIKLEKYKFDKAMGFDGGGSVSLFVKQKNGYFYQEREEKGASRAIKSALLVY